MKARNTNKIQQTFPLRSSLDLLRTVAQRPWPGSPRTHPRPLPRHVTRAAETANTCGVRTLHSTRNKQIQARVWLQVYGLLSKAGHSSYTTDTDSHKSSTQCHTIAFRCLYMYLSLQYLHISLLFHVALCSNLYDRTGKVWFPPQHPNEYRHWEHLWENSEANASGHQLHLNLSEMDWSNMKQLLFKLQNGSGEKLRGCCSKPQIFRAGKYMYIQKLLMSSKYSKCKCRSKAWRTHIPNSKLVKPTS